MQKRPVTYKSGPNPPSDSSSSFLSLKNFCRRPNVTSFWALAAMLVENWMGDGCPEFESLSSRGICEAKKCEYWCRQNFWIMSLITWYIMTNIMYVLRFNNPRSSTCGQRQSPTPGHLRRKLWAQNQRVLKAKNGCRLSKIKWEGRQAMKPLPTATIETLEIETYKYCLQDEGCRWYPIFKVTPARL